MYLRFKQELRSLNLALVNGQRSATIAYIWSDTKSVTRLLGAQLDPVVIAQCLSTLKSNQLAKKISYCGKQEMEFKSGHFVPPTL